MFKAFLVTAALIAAATPVLAESCDGTLKRIGGDLVLGPLPNERECTCIIAKADQPRVLQACRLNKRCIVSGKMQLCTEPESRPANASTSATWSGRGGDDA
jgi:hypothetical protein